MMRTARRETHPPLAPTLSSNLSPALSISPSAGTPGWAARAEKNDLVGDTRLLICTTLAISISFQSPVEEIRRRVISSQPGLVSKEVVHFIWEDQLLKLDVVFSELAHQIHRLTERHVAVVVAVNQQHRRFPFVDRRNRRGFTRELYQF